MKYVRILSCFVVLWLYRQFLDDFIYRYTPHLLHWFWGKITGYVTTKKHCCDVKMSVMASQLTGVLIVCSTVCSGPDHRKHQSSTSRAFDRAIHRWLVNSPHKGSVTRKIFPFDDVIVYKQKAKHLHSSWHVLWIKNELDGLARDCSNSNA